MSGPAFSGVWADWLAGALPVVEVPVAPDAGVVDGLGLARVVDVTTLVVTLADALAAVHALTPPSAATADAPSRQLGDLRELAAGRVELGRVEADAFDGPYRGHEPGALLDLAPSALPAHEPTVVLGLASLAHVRVGADGAVLGWAPAAVTGPVSAGWGDPYRDLATVAIELADAISPEVLGPFFDRYGIDRPELARLDAHVLLDQLLR